MLPEGFAAQHGWLDVLHNKAGIGGVGSIRIAAKAHPALLPADGRQRGSHRSVRDMFGPSLSSSGSPRAV